VEPLDDEERGKDHPKHEDGDVGPGEDDQGPDQGLDAEAEGREHHDGRDQDGADVDERVRRVLVVDVGLEAAGLERLDQCERPDLDEHEEDDDPGARGDRTTWRLHAWGSAGTVLRISTRGDRRAPGARRSPGDDPAADPPRRALRSQSDLLAGVQRVPDQASQVDVRRGRHREVGPVDRTEDVDDLADVPQRVVDDGRPEGGDLGPRRPADCEGLSDPDHLADAPHVRIAPR
jgi:hypothetical protein